MIVCLSCKFNFQRNRVGIHPNNCLKITAVMKAKNPDDASPGVSELFMDAIRETSDCRTISSLIQTILSVPESHQISHLRGSRTIPPVGNHTPPRRTYLIFLVIITLYKSTCKHFFGAFLHKSTYHFISLHHFGVKIGVSFLPCIKVTHFVKTVF